MKYNNNHIVGLTEATARKAFEWIEIDTKTGEDMTENGLF